MEKKKDVFYNKGEDCFYIAWLVSNDSMTAEFLVRCPSEKNNWNYYLVLGTSLHCDKPLLPADDIPCDCNRRPSGKCYPVTVRNSQADDELFKLFQASGEDSTIFSALEEVLTPVVVGQ